MTAFGAPGARPPGTTPVCSTCVLRALCRAPVREAWQAPLNATDTPRRQSVARGDALYRRGERFEALYAVHAGVFKTCTGGGPGGHVPAFPMSGELLGLDGLGTGAHTCDAIALEDASVCVVPYTRLSDCVRDSEPMQRAFHGLVGREVDAQLRFAARLACQPADARLAGFLRGQARRMAARGFSPTTLQLRMSRLEIGAHLGLTIETVSRCFGRLQSSGMLAVRGRTVEILDADALAVLAGADD